ncbi:hypothetical protein [Actinopolymorpha alba]|uniref:hypothetical protein n=1 Tax=Actinopolymorpha alba TaxID=533267 RepID=UPI00037DCB17|nr:hypothetical protein [Actinopolymorpha alba]
MAAELDPVIAAATRWLIRAYPPGDGFNTALAETQARQAVTIAAWLRYPTAIDAGLVALTGPGGSARLDWIAGTDHDDPLDEEHAWRTWVDEVVVSWAACLLSDHQLARTAVAASARTEHMSGMHRDFRRLMAPDEHDWSAATLLRHPDLVAPIADLHRAELLALLHANTAGAA